MLSSLENISILNLLLLLFRQRKYAKYFSSFHTLFSNENQIQLTIHFGSLRNFSGFLSFEHNISFHSCSDSACFYDFLASFKHIQSFFKKPFFHIQVWMNRRSKSFRLRFSSQKNTTKFSSMVKKMSTSCQLLQIEHFFNCRSKLRTVSKNSRVIHFSYTFVSFPLLKNWGKTTSTCSYTFSNHFWGQNFMTT